MPAPTNTSAATATVLTYPISLTQNANFDGTTYPLWYQVTATVTEMHNLFAYGGGTSYVASLTLYADDATTIVFDVNQEADVPVQFPAVQGDTYYLKVVSRDGDVADPAILTLTGVLPPVTGSARGDYLINSDVGGGWPAAIIAREDGAVQRFVALVSGEYGDVIPDGSGGFIYAFTNDDEDVSPFELVYYNTSLIETSRPYQFTSAVRGLRGNGSDKFYIADSSPAGTIKAINRSGSVVGTWTLPISFVDCLAPSRDDAILYFVEAGASKPIRRWDLVNNIELSQLVSAPVGYTAISPDMLVLANGNVLVTWNKTTDTYVAEYQPDGTLARTYAVTWPSSEKLEGPRLALTPDDDSSSFVVWRAGDDGVVGHFTVTGRWTEFATADGSILHTFDAYEFDGSRGPSGLSSGWPTFANNVSCPIVALRTALTPPTIVQIPPFDCGSSTATQPVTIYGTDFGSNPSVTATDPNGNDITFTVTSHTTTQIVGTLTVATCGEWDFTVTTSGLVSNTFSVDTGTNYIMRRVRRFILPPADQFRVFISRLEILAQTGVGLTTGQGSDPVVMFRISWDGGATWSNETQMSMGKIGEYFRRVYVNRLGSGRQPIAEIVVSDPVFVSLLDCYVDAEKGTS